MGYPCVSMCWGGWLDLVLCVTGLYKENTKRRSKTTPTTLHNNFKYCHC